MEPHQGSQIRVGLYARVSTEEQREGNTIESQIAELEKFTERSGWTIQGRYIDEGWSGALLARPELDRLRDDAGRGLFDVVLVNDVDRLARDVAHLGIIKRDLERRRVRLVFRKLPATSDPMNNLMVNILGSFAEFERELIVDRTRRGRRHKAEVRKQYVGCIAPYGYKYIKKSLSGGVGILEVNPDEASAVKQMFRWVAEEGISSRKVAQRLTRLKIPTRTGGTVWANSSVCRILRNRTYTGIWTCYKTEACEPLHRRNDGPYRHKSTGRRARPSEWVEVNLPDELKLIPTELWESVQRQIDKNPTFSPRNVKVQYLLQGLLRCQFCSGTLTGKYCRDPYGTYIYYKCSRSCSNLRWIRRDHLENAVWNRVKSALLDPAYLESRTAAALERISNGGHEIEQRQKDIAIENIEEKETALLRQYQNNRISPQQLSAELEELKNQRNQILSTTPVDLDQDPADVHAAVTKYCEQIKNKLTNPTFETKKHILRHLISLIVANNESVQITGALSLTATETAEHFPPAIESPHRREHRRNCRGLNFELIATLPRHEGRHIRRDERTRERASL
jgi:site-specific DNA recombinase